MDPFDEALHTKTFAGPDAVALLRATGEPLGRLYARADAVRHECMGDAVYLRGIIEFSNHCDKNCFYCGIRAGNRKAERYELTEEVLLAAAREIEQSGATTVVLQAGESPAFGDRRLGRIIERLRRETKLAVTVSVGCRPRETYAIWKECGMDRCLLRFETSDPALYRKLHPDSTLEERLEALRHLRQLGVQTGSGFLIGAPGETVETLAGNIGLCRTLDLDMIGIGPFIPHPDTPLGRKPNAYASEPEMFFKALAVLRLFNPQAHIPATTAYDAVFPGRGRELALQRGANVFMPNFTPAPYRARYLLYPNKPCVQEPALACASCAVERIQAMGRTIGTGRGDTLKTRS